jgi:antagonist of KipI
VSTPVVLQVISPGMLATVQDLGRPGCQSQGVPVSGAMDRFSLQAGNIVLGNPRGAAGLEIALQGPSLRVLGDIAVCVFGADLGASVDGAVLARGRAVVLKPGQVISFSGQRAGVWAYLCVEGGLDVPLVLGSRSTYMRARLGGVEGRSLRAGDSLRALQPGGAPRRANVPALELPGRVTVRAVPGPQDGMFPPESIETFFSTEFRVTAQSDRMGYRLQGPALKLAGAADILSDGTALGAVQVPAGGQPIVLMADRQTTGGYAKIATVISPDVPRLAQLPPGGVVTFSRVSVEEAQDAAAEQARLLESLEKRTGT